MKQKSLFAALLLLFCTTSLWASYTSVGGIWYDFNQTSLTATVTYRGSSSSDYSNEYSGSVVIPATVTYDGKMYSVTSIGNSAFYNCTSLTSVTIGNSVTSIGGTAFLACSKLTSVTIGNGVTSIGERAFQNCSNLLSVTIPNSVTSIGLGVFSGCSGLTSVTIGNGVTSIGVAVFSGCSGLTSIEIPNSVTSIMGEAFYGCSNLTSVTIPSSVTSIGGIAFYGCSNLTSVTIPSSVTSIEGSAFSGCSSLPVVDNVRYADTYLVEAVDKNLSSYKISENTKFIGGAAFSGCSSLTSVAIPSSVTSIGANAFYGCSNLASVTIPNSVTSIGDDIFSRCISLSSIEIPNSVTSIGKSAFYGCSGLTSITIGEGVTSIGESAFYGCSGLTSITIGEGVTSIGYKAFYNCTSLTSIEIPNSVTSIGEYAFDGCRSLPVVDNIRYADTYLVEAVDRNLSSYKISENTRIIGRYAFSDCSSLTSVTIPNGVTSIGHKAFDGCYRLTSVTLNSNSIVSREYTDEWNIKNIFGSQVKEYDLGEGVTSIGDYAFSECSNLTSVTIPNSVTSIGTHAFYGCSSLTSVTIPESVMTINQGATFQKCTALKSVLWNAKNCTIDEYDTNNYYPPFNNLDNITDFTIGETVETLPAYLCHGLSGINSITIPSSVKSIGIGAFYGCSSLTSVTIPESVMTINQGATFQKCTALKSVQWNAKNCTIEINKNNNYWPPFNNLNSITDFTIGETVETLPAYLCRGLSGINSITIPASVKSIGACAFKDCTGLTSIELPMSISNIEERAFYNCSNLTFATIHAEMPPTIGTEILTTTIPVYVPCGTLNAYKATDWNDYNIQYAPFDTKLIVNVENNMGGNVDVIRDECEEATITATPNAGYVFIQWTDGNKDNPRAVEIISDTTFTAVFDFASEGTCGDDNLLTWSYDSESKSLTVSGNGTLNSNYTYGVHAPEEAKFLTISDGITSIGEEAFNGFSSLETLTLGKDISAYGERAFAGCPNLKAIFNYRPRPSKLGSTVFEDTDNFECILYVLASSINMYTSSASNWKDFFYFIEPIGATETTTSEEEVSIQAANNSAEVTWPAVENAATYELTITDRDGNVICTLIFNAQGQLISIAFAAPGRGQSAGQIAGLTFTVTGLDSGSSYGFTMEAKDSQGEVIDSKEGTFTTTGGIATVVDNASVNAKPTKVIRDGQLFILRDGKTYTVQGQEVR